MDETQTQGFADYLQRALNCNVWKGILPLYVSKSKPVRNMTPPVNIYNTDIIFKHWTEYSLCQMAHKQTNL